MDRSAPKGKSGGAREGKRKGGGDTGQQKEHDSKTVNSAIGLRKIARSRKKKEAIQGKHPTFRAREEGRELVSQKGGKKKPEAPEKKKVSEKSKLHPAYRSRRNLATTEGIISEKIEIKAGTSKERGNMRAPK